MDCARFIVHFEGTIDGIAPGSVDLKTEFQQLPQWDSLALLMCISMIESEYGVRIAGKDVSRCRTIADLCEWIEKRGDRRFDRST